MSNARAFLVMGLVLLAFCLPNAQAQAATPGISNPLKSTPTKLYFHIGANQDFPINTQLPDDKFVRDDSFGMATESLTCVPPNGAADGVTQHRYTTYYGFSSPGYVEYNFTENGLPRIHPERGLSFDVNLDDAAPFTAYWALSTFTGAQDPGAPAPNPNSGTIPVPNVVVRATMRTGEKITLNDEGYNNGEIIAQGQTDPTTLLGDQSFTTAGGTPSAPGTHPQVTYAMVNGLPVYYFAVPMKFQKNVIPKDQGYSVRIDVFQSLPTCDMSSGDQYAMLNLVRAHSSPKFRPHLELNVMNPIRIEYMHPQFVGDDMVIHTSENSPWGNYDVDETPGGIELSITGANGPVSGVYRAAVVQRYHEHDHHTQAVDVTFVWPYKQVNAKDGGYTINLAVKNDQGSAVASGIAKFQIGKELTVTKCGGLTSVAGAQTDQNCINEIQNERGEALDPNSLKKSPDLELVGAIAAVGAVSALLRRRL